MRQIQFVAVFVVTACDQSDRVVGGTRSEKHISTMTGLILCERLCNTGLSEESVSDHKTQKQQLGDTLPRLLVARSATF